MLVTLRPATTSLTSRLDRLSAQLTIPAHVVRDSMPRATGRTNLRLVLCKEPSLSSTAADVEACGGAMSMVILDKVVDRDRGKVHDMLQNAAQCQSTLKLTCQTLV